MDTHSLQFFANRRMNTLKDYKTGFTMGAFFCFGGAIWLEEANPIKTVLGLLILVCLWASYQCDNQVKRLQSALNELSSRTDEELYHLKAEGLQYLTVESLFSIIKG